jgi:DNA-binding PadR family transcriptional regulator
MALGHAFLGLLETGPAHGYELKKRFDAGFPSARPVSFGQVYATLARLARHDLVDVSGVEAGDGPDRKLYVITAAGVSELEKWLGEPQPAPDHARGELFTRVVVALLTARPATHLLEAQRTVYLRRMRELTDRRRDADLVGKLACDLEISHLEADLRWMDRAAARVAKSRAAATKDRA